MREVNFSIPNVNKASVGITTALYDRRALDCTSTLPLINSLNHLAYLTTSSARIRDILTVDGGVERLVCILKQGRSREMMEMWKWNLAFQCVVNIGVRGSESVRTRVVEADMVPVIATILENYITVIDKVKEKAESETERLVPGRHGGSGRSSSRHGHTRKGRHEEGEAHATPGTGISSRRHPPPPSIAIPPPPPQRLRSRTYGEPAAMDVSPTLPTPGSPPRTSTYPAHRRSHQHRGEGMRSPAIRSATPPAPNPQLLTEATAELGLRPVRDAERLPSMLPSIANGNASQPESPTTPGAPIMLTTTTATRERRRPPLRQRLSASTDADDIDADQSPAEMDQENLPQDGEPMVDIQTDVNIEGANQADNMLEVVAQPLDLTTPAGSEGGEVETLNTIGAPAQDGSIIPTNIRGSANDGAINLQQAQSPLNTSITPPTPTQSSTTHGRYSLSPNAHPAVLAAMPRDEDVLMSLQLLAYVSKYCNLRTYFQNSHLVPKLQIGARLGLLETSLDSTTIESVERRAREEAEREEFLLADDYNIFPLVEKFTVRHHSQDMQYWAGVVMRNLCRKDDSQGGIRQCAYWKCGKWERYTRQFAKCRRCRRTKYCSKDCQKNAWVYHRHWCQVANP